MRYTNPTTSFEVFAEVTRRTVYLNLQNAIKAYRKGQLHEVWYFFGAATAASTLMELMQHPDAEHLKNRLHLAGKIIQEG